MKLWKIHSVIGKVIVEDNSLGLACVLDDAVLLDTDLALGGLQRLQSNEKFNLYKLAALKTSCCQYIEPPIFAKS